MKAQNRAAKADPIERSAAQAAAPHLELLKQTSSRELNPKFAAAGLLMLWLSDDVTASVNARLAAFGVTEKKFDILMLFGLAERGLLEVKALTPSYISEYFDVTRSSVTGLLDWLEDRKLLARRSHTEDRRSLLLELTPSGRKLLNEALPHFWHACESIASALTAKECETLQAILGKVWVHLKAHAS
jgi:MarR family transcriptional repressor of emrRAB